jgi:uncharacterized Tic20 family protein
MSVPPESAVPNPPVAGGSAEDRNLAMLTHLSGIILGFIVPLIVWLVNKDNAAKSYLTTEAKEALNFQLTILIAYVVGAILSLVLIGYLLIFAAWALTIIFGIMAAIAANSGQYYKYPLSITFVH